MYSCTIKRSFFFCSSQKPLKLIGSLLVMSGRVTDSLDQETSVSGSRTVVLQHKENFNPLSVSEVQVIRCRDSIWHLRVRDTRREQPTCKRRCLRIKREMEDKNQSGKEHFTAVPLLGNSRMHNVHLHMGNNIWKRHNESREDGTQNAGRCRMEIKEGISDARWNSDIFLAADAEHSTQVFPRTRTAGGWAKEEEGREGKRGVQLLQALLQNEARRMAKQMKC